ncbi:MAG: hypothetical protein HY817_03950 [Candidatus Abawacabacteria bacterium]|nr:hypothetical protein [Candidatus Abawacabacteria bacterium]
MLNPQTTYFGRIKQALELIPQNPLMFIALPIFSILITYIIGPAIVGILVTLLYPLLQTYFAASTAMIIYLVIGIIVMLIISVILQGVTLLSQITTTAQLDQEKKDVAGTIIQKSFSQLGSYVRLSIRIAIYFLIPMLLVIAVMILYAVLNTIVSSGVMDYSFASGLNSILGIVGTIALLWAILSIILRGPRTIFAFHFLAIKKYSAKEAFQESLQITKGRWGKMILHILAFGIVAFVVQFIVNLIPDGTLAMILQAIVEALLLSTWVIYTYLFLKVTEAQPAVTVTPVKQ